MRRVGEFFFSNANEPGATNWAYTVVDLRLGWVRQMGEVDVQPFVGIDALDVAMPASSNGRCE